MTKTSALWGSYWDGYPRAFLRRSLFAMSTFEFAGQAYQIARMAGDHQHYEATGSLSHALAPFPLFAWVLFAVLLVGLLLVVTDRAPVRGGIGALLVMSFMSLWQTEIAGSPSRNSFFVGAALLGWTLGQGWAQRIGGEASGVASRERLAEAGTLGALAAAYVASALSKLLSTGLEWTNPSQIRSLVLAQEPVADWAWLALYRETLLASPDLARGAAAATLIIEGGALLLLFGPRLRLVWAALIFGMHVNIILLCTMPYIEPMFFMLTFAVPWPFILRMKRIDEPELTPRIPREMAAVLIGIVILAACLSPFGWRAFNGDHPHHDDHSSAHHH